MSTGASLRSPDAESLPAFGDILTLVGPDIEKGSWNNVATICEEILSNSVGPASGKDFAGICYLAALGKMSEEKLVDAAKYAEMAFNADGGVYEYADLLAVLHAQLGDLTKSLFCAKMAGAVPSREDLKGITPDFVPSLANVFMEVVERPLLQKALSAAANEKWLDAVHWFEQQLQQEPGNRAGYIGFVHCLMALGRFREALDVLRSAAHGVPRDAEIHALMGFTLAALGEFEASRSCHAYSRDLDPDSLSLSSLGITDAFMTPGVSPSEMAAECADWMARFGVTSDFPMARPAIEKDRITVGYVVGPYGRRQGSKAFSEILAYRNGEKFQAVGFGFGNLTDGSNRHMQKAFDVWHDVQGMDAITLGALVDAEDVDILIDLGGFTCPELAVSFVSKNAPVQVSWVGAPFGIGTEQVDARLSDSYVEEGTNPAIYKENVVHGDLINLLIAEPSGRVIANAERADEVLTYGVDATLRELTSESIRLWASILHETPEAMIALRDHDFKNSENLNRLMSLFGNFGLAHRIDLISTEDDSEFFGNIDILLVPLAGSRAELPVGAINHGIPVVCMAGDSVPTRMSSLAVKGVGAEEKSIAQTAADYIEFAKYWSESVDARQKFAENWAGKVGESPLFDFKARSKGLEDILSKLWQEACSKG